MTKRRITVFNSVSLDGYFTGENGDLSWAHKSHDDKEWNDFVSSNAGGKGTLLFGRVTYDMMASYWPTPAAAQFSPAVARAMNDKTKIVVSRTLRSAEWKNTTVIEDLVTSTRTLKQEDGEDIVVLGSGRVVAQLAQHDLIDAYQFVVVPVALGRGRTMFEGIEKEIALRLVSSRTFGNGNTLLTYQPIR